MKAWHGLLSGAAVAFCFAATAHAQTFIEGTHYTRLDTPVQVRVPEGKIEVREFFWYGCPHCFKLEPYINKWEKPENVEFVTTPAVLGKNWVAHAYAYYALEALGKLDELHTVLFHALHTEKRRLLTIGQLAELFEHHGIKRAKFEEAVKSFLVDTQVKRAENLGKSYSISGVPTFVIGGKYKTSPSMTGDYETFFKVVDFLIGQAGGKQG